MGLPNLLEYAPVPPRPRRRVQSLPTQDIRVRAKEDEEWTQFEQECQAMENTRQQHVSPRTPLPKRVSSCPILTESWDDDFDLEEDMSLPQVVSIAQERVARDIQQVTKFAESMTVIKDLYEQLRAVRSDAAFMKESQEIIQQVEMLLHLAEFQEDKGSLFTVEDLKILKRMVQREDIAHFGPECIAPLLGQLPGLQQTLRQYLTT
jgi:hypothetical protein